MPEPTVLLVVPALEIGGAQETAVSLALHLPAAGWRVVVVTFRDGPVRADLEAAGAPVEIVADRRHRAIALPWFVADMLRDSAVRSARCSPATTRTWCRSRRSARSRSS